MGHLVPAWRPGSRRQAHRPTSLAGPAKAGPLDLAVAALDQAELAEADQGHVDLTATHPGQVRQV